MKTAWRNSGTSQNWFLPNPKMESIPGEQRSRTVYSTQSTTQLSLSSFSYFTFGNSILPCRLSSICSHSINKRDVELKWATAWKLTMQDFQYKKRKRICSFGCFIKGKGIQNELSNYSYTDKSLESGKSIFTD